MSAAQPGQPGQNGSPGPPPDVYRSVLALVVWWVWVVFAAANVVDLAIQGHNHFSLVVVAALILITGIAYVSAFRPKVLADDDGMTIRNPLRDHRVPWSCVEDLDLGDSLLVRCSWEDGEPRRKKLYAWAVHSPRRSRIKAEMRGGRSLWGVDRQPQSVSKLPPDAKAAVSKTDAEQIVDSLRARAARSNPPATGKPVSGWHLLSVAVLVIPAVLVIIVALT